MSSKHSKLVWSVCLQVLFVLLVFRHAESGSIVKYLPGFSGPLPFKLETGYISVGEVELFYLFVESQGKPFEDPLMVYLIGGPGCSALNGFFYQTGPLQFNITDYSGGLPTLNLYPYTWTKTANIIYLDLPAGTGYSYSNTANGYYASDLLSANQTHIFIRKWLDDHPEFITNRFFVTTDSYSGISAPIVAQEILNGNNAGLEPPIDLVGIISGSPHTNVYLEQNTKITLAYRLGLLSHNLYESAKNNCKGDYIDTDSASAECLVDLEEIDQCLEMINTQMVLAPKCATISPRSEDEHLLLPSSRETDYWCKNFAYLLSDIWANNKAVQRALHVRQGTVQVWARCNLTLIDTYHTDVTNSIHYHQNLTHSGLQLLIYGGDHDLVIPHISTEYWISTLNQTVDEDWRAWYVDGQVAGYTVSYKNDNGYRLTYATLKGSGHSPTEWKGKQANQMFERWIHFYPL